MGPRGGYGQGGMYGGGTLGIYSHADMSMAGLDLMDPNSPSLTQTLESTTQHTFMLLQSIMQILAGVAQLLEGPFMATHSSFLAMGGIVDQLRQLCNALGRFLGLFGLLRWMKYIRTGRLKEPALRGEFPDFLNGRPVQEPR